MNTSGFFPGTEKGDFYLTASRLVLYKKTDLIVEAFKQLPNQNLVVIGDGPDLEMLREKAPDNVTLLGHQSFENLVGHMQKAKAFVLAANEDFGITSLEAQACGTPVIAFGKGGYLETVIPGETGLFFAEQTPESLAGAISQFESGSDLSQPERIRKHALEFSSERFEEKFRNFVDEKWRVFRGE